MPKYNVVKFVILRYEATVDAKTAADAYLLADYLDDSFWIQDFDYYEEELFVNDERSENGTLSKISEDSSSSLEPPS